MFYLNNRPGMYVTPDDFSRYEKQPVEAHAIAVQKDVEAIVDRMK